MKFCTKCEVTKDLSQFHTNKRAKDGAHAHCKQCSKAYHKARYEANKEQILAEMKVYYEDNREDKIAYSRARYESKKEEINKQKAEYSKRPDVRKTQNAKNVEKRKTDPLAKLKKTLSSASLKAFKNQGLKKSERATRVLGCSVLELHEWLKSKFQDDWTMANHGKAWHIDHVIPIAAWDLSNSEHVKACFHWTNLQPLAPMKNYIKGGPQTPEAKLAYLSAIQERLMVLRCLDVL